MRITIEGEVVVVPIEYQMLPLMCKQCQVCGCSTAQCSKKSPSTSSQPNQEWTIVGNGKHRNHPTQLSPCPTLTTSPASTKHAANPQAVLADSEDELEKMLESIVSSSQKTLILSQNEVPNPQVSTSMHQETIEEAVNTNRGSDPLSQQMLLITPMHNGTLERGGRQ